MSGTLGITPWLTLGVAALFLYHGAHVAFPLPIFCAVWGFSVLHMVSPATRQAVALYIVLSTGIALLMISGSLLLISDEDGAEVPVEQAEVILAWA